MRMYSRIISVKQHFFITNLNIFNAVRPEVTVIYTLFSSTRYLPLH